MWNPLRRSAIEQRTEAEVYSRPQKTVIPLQLIGLGEAEVGPVWFGRGFAAPPRHFTSRRASDIAGVPFRLHRDLTGELPCFG